MSIRVETRKVSQQFGSFWALQDLSLNFEPGKIHAVLGENGAGKSTLMKILFGLQKPSLGEIYIDGQRQEFKSALDAIHLGLGMVQQHFCLVENLSAIDNIILGAEPTNMGLVDRERAKSYLESKLNDEHLKIPWDTQVSELGVGYRQRIEILKLLYRDAQFLILDEPTAVLTPQEIKSFFNSLKQLKKQGRTIVMITHKINEVFEVCDEFHVIRSGKFIASGDVSKSSPSELVRHMIGRELASFEIKNQNPGEIKLKLDQVSADTELGSALKQINLNIRAGEIVGIAGVEGSGQSSLVDCLMGLCEFDGKIQFLEQIYTHKLQTKLLRQKGLSLVPEDRHTQAISLDESCEMNMIVGLEENFQQSGFFDSNKIKQITAEWIKKFDIKLSSLEQKISGLSGGNQQKLVFAREILGRDCQFLICHQPTRGVDLGAIESIHNEILKLRDQMKACLLLSSELDELIKLSDRIYVMFKGAIVAEFNRSEFSREKIGEAMTGAIFLKKLEANKPEGMNL